MKKINLLLIFCALVSFWSCKNGSDNAPKFTCGMGIPTEQLSEFAVKTNPAYPPLELKLLGKLSLAIFEANNRIKNYNVQFFENTRQRLVVQVYGIWEPVEMDKAACAVLNFQDYQLPENTLVVFYRNEKKAEKMDIVAGVRKK